MLCEKKIKYTHFAGFREVKKKQIISENSDILSFSYISSEFLIEKM